MEDILSQVPFWWDLGGERKKSRCHWLAETHLTLNEVPTLAPQILVSMTTTHTYMQTFQ